MGEQRLRLETRAGVQDLGRVVNVLALLDLTPTRLSAVRHGKGLVVEAWLEGDPRTVTLCVERLRAFAALAEVSLALPTREDRPCETLSA